MSAAFIVFAADFFAALLRWFHIVAAIAWVGASFYFIWLENALNRGANQRNENIAGHLWAVHGGGFYYLEKYKNAPAPLPAPLHWFKWEAYATWLSGMALMVVVYYANAPARLLAENAPVGGAMASALSVLFLIAGYGVYALLCRTPLIGKPLTFSFVGLLLLALSAELLFLIFSPRAVFLHIGALIGTMMSANVAMVIIPAQKRMVADAKAGRDPKPGAGTHAALRSLHNNYLALPVVFLMVAGHAPFFYDNRGATLAMIFMMLCSFAARHFFNCKNRGMPANKWLWIAAVFALLSGAPAAVNITSRLSAAGDSDFAAARVVIHKHCAQCHSESPTYTGMPAAPGGLLLESDEQIKTARELILKQAVLTEVMPPANITKMTKEERAVLGAWAQSEQ